MKTKFSENSREGMVGAAFAVLVGLVLGFLPAGKGLVHLSYDLPFAFASQAISDEVVIVKMDEPSYRPLGQIWGQEWDRSWHARLLDQLKAANCKMVVFDVVFADPGSEQADKELARAIAAHGRVVLAADRVPLALPGMSGEQTVPPWETFLNATTNWGITRVENDTDGAVRWHYAGTDLDASLPWAAAALVNAPVTEKPAQRQAERWLRYYGPDATLPNISYYLALSKTNDFFQDKIVFIGGKPRTLFVGQETDLFRTPYTRWTGEGISGVEIMATTFLNLLHGDWLTRLSAGKEFLLILFCGLIFGYGLSLFRPLTGGGVALASMFGVSVLALILFWLARVWFSWVVIAGAQIPIAWACATVLRTAKLHREMEGSGKKPAPFPQPEEQTRRQVDIPEHRLVRRVGKGAFGEVWLAQNAIGTFHAVKIVYRQDFKDDDSYAREFRGIQKYMPISLKHLSLLHILQVGRNDAAGHYYCVMEIADDETAGTRIDPNTYTPQTLGRELHKRGRIPVEECVSIGLALTDALDFLHKQELIHRDIKPSNIIFVGGVPKLADIGLVTDIAGKGKDASYGGTEGYIAPEGPGTAAADMYGLGKVMYEASMGRDRLQFPELPSTITTRSDVPVLLRLNTIILKACETDVTRRYQSAAEMRADLLELQAKLASLQQR